MPFFEGYQGKLDKSSLGLYQAARVASYHGLIFANWESGSGSLDDYLGDMRWVFDLLFGRTEGMEVVGAPMRWEVEANWKLGAANFAGDGIHILTTHGFRSALGLQDKLQGERVSYRLSTENGHAATLSLSLPNVMETPYLTLPKELWPELESHLTKGQLRVMKSLINHVGNIFPNFSFINLAAVNFLSGPAVDQPIPFLTVRQWQPKGPDKMEVWS